MVSSQALLMSHQLMQDKNYSTYSSKFLAHFSPKQARLISKSMTAQAQLPTTASSRAIWSRLTNMDEITACMLRRIVKTLHLFPQKLQMNDRKRGTILSFFWKNKQNVIKQLKDKCLPDGSPDALQNQVSVISDDVSEEKTAKKVIRWQYRERSFWLQRSLQKPTCFVWERCNYRVTFGSIAWKKNLLCFFKIKK